jgi:hypothetical protein
MFLLAAAQSISADWSDSVLHSHILYRHMTAGTGHKKQQPIRTAPGCEQTATHLTSPIIAIFVHFAVGNRSFRGPLQLRFRSAPRSGLLYEYYNFHEHKKIVYRNNGGGILLQTLVVISQVTCRASKFLCLPQR